jgi:hypothetical protein
MLTIEADLSQPIRVLEELEPGFEGRAAAILIS